MNLSLTGYIQPQFQVAQQQGAQSYNGGNFAENTNNRFMLRRARIKVDYVIPSKKKQQPLASFTLQIDATERGVSAKDVFLRVFEPKHGDFSLTPGLFARPFGFEVNLSSAYRETPERGRMSQILMPSERDLGVMLSFEPAKKPVVKFDLGMFNGQGLSGTTDFDSYKDLISRLRINPVEISKQFYLSGGISLLAGGWMQATKYRYEVLSSNSVQMFVVDSSENNLGAKAPRKYYGADLQISYRHGWGKTELRGEYWRGKQPGTATSTNNPGTLPLTPTYLRNFDGAFFYLLQNVANEKWEAVVKYDWYDPNIKVMEADIGVSASNLTAADIRYSTMTFGVNRYFNDNLKLLLFYDVVRNESTLLPDYTADKKDNVLTCRMQIRF